VFIIAGIWGLLIVPPMFFVRARLELQNPPPITHPEFYYGFAAVVTVWQLAFLVIGSDPQRFRPLMLAGVGEKVGWVTTLIVLYLLGELAPGMLVFAAIDGFLGVLFAIAFVRTSAASS
jgi:hypothetical protein